MVMQSHGQTWWHSVQPMQRGRSMVQTWKAASWRGPGIVLMQSTGQTTRHASQPVHMSSSSKARTLGSFFFAIDAQLYEAAGAKQASWFIGLEGGLKAFL